MCWQASKETDRQEGRQVGSAAMLAGSKADRQLGRQAGWTEKKDMIRRKEKGREGSGLNTLS